MEKQQTANINLHNVKIEEILRLKSSLKDLRQHISNDKFFLIGNLNIGNLEISIFSDFYKESLSDKL